MLKDSEEEKDNSLQLETRIAETKDSYYKPDYNIICQNSNIRIYLPRKSPDVLEISSLKTSSSRLEFNFAAV